MTLPAAYEAGVSFLPLRRHLRTIPREAPVSEIGRQEAC